jgi:hypothetical protein
VNSMIQVCINIAPLALSSQQCDTWQVVHDRLSVSVFLRLWHCSFLIFL